MAHSLTHRILGKNFKKVLLLCSLFVTLSSGISAQTDTIFWFAVPEIDATHGDSPINLRFATGKKAATITISIPANTSFTPIVRTISANSTLSVDLSNYKSLLENDVYDIANNRGLLIKSTSKVAAYYEVINQTNSDVFALKGKNALGKEFYATFQNSFHNKFEKLSNGDDQIGPEDSLPLPFSPVNVQDNWATNSWSSIDIVATEDGTEIEITPSNPAISSANTLDAFGRFTGDAGHPTGVTFTVKLNKGQTYSLRAAFKNAKRHLGGTKIKVTKGGDIAVTVKDDTILMFDNKQEWDCYGGDIVGDQMVPTNLIGTQYVVMKGSTQPENDNNVDKDYEGEFIYIIGTKNGTIISINGNSVATIAEGETFAYEITNPITTISTSNPAYAFHVAGFGCEVGGALLPTVSTCTGSTQLAFTRAHNDKFILNLMTQAGAENSFLVNGVKRNELINPASFLPVPGTDWVAASFDLTTSTSQGQTFLISDTTDVFHMGILNKSIVSSDKGAFYGYFTDFNEFKPEVLFPDSIICLGQSIQFEVKGGLKYQWRSLLQYLDDPNSETPTASGMPVGTYDVIIDVIGGCDKKLTLHRTFTVVPPINKTLTGPGSVCLNDPIATYFVPADTNCTFTWTVPAGGTVLSGAGTNSITVRWTTTGSKKITVDIDNQGCEAQKAEMTVAVNAPPSVDDITVKTCVGLPELVDMKPVGGLIPYTHVWSAPTLPIGYKESGSTITLTASNSAGVPSFVYVVTDGNKCSDTAKLMIQVFQNPIIDIPLPQSTCQFNPDTIRAAVTGSNNPKLQWFNSSPAIIPGDELTSAVIHPRTDVSGAFALKLLVTDSIGCKDTIEFDYLIYPEPVASVTPTSNPKVCQENNLELTGSVFPNVVSYKWEGPGASNLSPNARVTTFNSNTVGNHELQFIVTTDKGCDDTLFYNVVVKQNPMINAGADQEVCAGINKQLVSTLSGGTAPFMYTWKDQEGKEYTLPRQDTVSYLQPKDGLHTMYLTVVDSNGCKDSDTLLITVHPNPKVKPDTAEVCLYENLTVNGNPSGGSGSWASHSWTGSHSSNLSAGNETQSPTFSSKQVGPHYLNYKVTDSHGCVASGSSLITVNGLPQPVITSKTLFEVCSGKELGLEVTGVANNLQFLWSDNGSDFLSSKTIFNPVFKHSDLATTIYTLVVKATDGKECNGYDTIAVTVNQLPTPSIKSDSLCAGESIRLQGDPTYTGHGWTGDVSLIPASLRTSQNPTFISEKIYTDEIHKITYTATDTKGCVDSTMFTIKVNALPHTEAGADIDFAFGDVIDFKGSPAGAQYDYTWTPADSMVNNKIQNPTSVKLYKSGIYWLTVENMITHCSDSDFVQITDTTGNVGVRITPMPNEICYGDTSMLKVTAYGGKRPYTYQWNRPYELQYTNGSIRVKPGVTTTYTITVTDDNGNKDVDSITVIVNQLPVISLINDTVCANDTIQIKPSVTPQGTATVSNVEWTGNGTPGLHGVTKQSDVDFFYNADGIYTLVLTANDSKSCSNSDTMTVVVNELPIVSIVASTTEICAGHKVDLSVDKTAGAAISSYSWTEDKPTHLDAASGATNSFVSDDNGLITLSVIDENGCKDTTSTSITVNVNPVVKVMDTSICQGDTLVIDGKPSTGSGNYISHEWSGTDVLLLSPANTQSTSFSTANPAIYSIQYKVVDDNNCADSTTIRVTIDTLPSATISDIREVCQRSPLELTANPQPRYSVVVNRWIEPGKPLQGNCFSVIMNSDSVGVKHLFYEVETNRGCKVTVPVDVTVKSKPEIAIVPQDSVVCQFSDLSLQSEVSMGTGVAQSYSWTTSPANPPVLSSFDATQVVLNKDEVGPVDVTLVYIDANTCSDTSNVTINVTAVPDITIEKNDWHACQGQGLVIDASANSLKKRTYEWIGGTGLDYLSDKWIAAPTFLTSEVGEYTLIYKITEKQYNCETIDTINVRVTPTPVKQVYDTTICQSEFEILNLDVAKEHASTYTWETTNAPYTVSFMGARVIHSLVQNGTFNYNIIESSAEGCTDTSKYDITIIEKPRVNLPANVEVYYLQEFTFKPEISTSQAVSYVWYSRDLFKNNLIKDAETVKLEADTTVHIIVTETVSGLGCRDTSYSRIDVAETMKLTLEVNNDTICLGDAVLLTANTKNGALPKTFTWSTGRNLTIQGYTDSYIYTPLKSETISVTVTDGYDTKIASISIVVNPIARIDSISNIEVCNGGFVEVPSFNSSVYGTTFEWTNSNTAIGLEATSGVGQIAAFRAKNESEGDISGIITITPTANNCEGVKRQFTITVKPTVKVPPTIDSVCQGGDAQLDIIISDNIRSYAWISTGGDNSLKELSNTQIKDPVFSSKIAGVYVYSVEIENVNGCKYIATKTVNNNPNPIITPMLVQQVCSERTIPIKPTVTNASSFSWTGDMSLLTGVSSTSPNVEFGPHSTKGTYIYTLTASNIHGCTSSTKITVENNITPASSVINETVCAGDQKQLLAIVSGADYYSWDGENLEHLDEITIPNPIFTAPNKSGYYTYSVNTSTTALCSNATTVNITVVDRPQLSVPETRTTYYGDEYEFNVEADTVLYTYTWTDADKFTMIHKNRAQTIELFETTFLNLNVRNTSGLACPVDFPITIKIREAMSITMNTVDVCDGDEIILFSNVKGGATDKKYTWRVNGVKIDNEEPSYSYTPRKQDVINLEVSDGYDTQTKTITINWHPKPEVDIQPSMTALVTGISHNIRVRELSAGTPGYEYRWKNSSGGLFSKVSASATAYTATSDGTQNIEVEVTDRYGCGDTAFLNPTSFARPEWPTVFCAGSAYTFTHESPVAVVMMVTSNGVTSEYDGNTPLLLANTGVTRIDIFDTNDMIYPIFTERIFVNSSIYVDFTYTPDEDVNIEELVHFNNLTLDSNSHIANNLMFYWDFVGEQVFTSELAEPTYKYDDIGKFDVSLIAVDTVSGCRDTATKTIEVVINKNCDAKYPNTFTPGASENGVFQLGYSVGLKDSGYNLKIYNKWGQLLFETNDRYKGWNGIFKNELCKQDVYTYHSTQTCENGTVLNINSDVTLIK